MNTIRLDFGDLKEIVRRVLPAVADDDLDAFGHVRAEPRGDSIRWVATDTYRMVTLERGTHDGLPEPVLIPANLLDFASRAAPNLGNDEVEISVGEEHVAIAVGDLTVPRPLIEEGFPDIDRLFDAVPDSCPVSVRIWAPALVAAIHANVTFAGPDGWEKPIGLTRSDQGPLELTARWDDRPDTNAFVSCEADGEFSTLVNPRFLLQLLDAVGPCETTLLVGGAGEPIRLRTDDGLHALLMPFDSETTRLRVLIGDAMQRDPDALSSDNGRISFEFPGVTIRAEPHPGLDPFGRDTRVVFVAELVSDLDSDLELLSEINQLNQQNHLSQLLLCDGLLEARSAHQLPNLSPSVIESVCHDLARQATDVAPLIEALHR